MLIVHTIDDLRNQIKDWHAKGRRVGFVPTMGNLHAGHLRLVQEARRHSDKVVCSIFVNPMQFGPGEDLDDYPRTLEEDKTALKQEQAELVFIPSVETIYPRDLKEQTYVEVPKLGDILCGLSRPGHFRGVATVVSRLFNLVQADTAIFGKKDYQQLLIIRRMTEDLGMPVEIIGVDTVREEDGLAMSSRNNYLDTGERKQAPELYATLLLTGEALQEGRRDYEIMEQEAEKRLSDHGFKPDYYRVLTQHDLANPDPQEDKLVILAAAYLGKTRLIDNLEVHCQQRTKTG